MSVVAFIREMVGAGFSYEDAVRAAEIYERTAPPEVKARGKGADRQARYVERKRQQASQSVINDANDACDVIRDVCDADAALSLPSSPPAPPQLPTHTRVVVTTCGREAADWPEGKASDHAAHLARLNPNIDPQRKPGLVTSMGEIFRWRSAGYSWDLDVVPAVMAHAAQPRASPVGTWAYFAPAIAQAHANRTRPVETVEAHREPSRRTPRAAAYADRLSDIDRAMAAACQ